VESGGEENRGSCLGASGHDDRQRGGPALGYGSPWHAEGGRVHDANRSRSRRRQRLRPSGEEGREWGEGKRGDEASAGLVEAGRQGAQALGRAAARALPRRTGRRRQHLLWVAAISGSDDDVRTNIHDAANDDSCKQYKHFVHR